MHKATVKLVLLVWLFSWTSTAYFNGFRQHILMDFDSKFSWISTAYFNGFRQHILIDFDSKFSWIWTAYFHGFRQQVFMDFDSIFSWISTASFHGFRYCFSCWHFFNGFWEQSLWISTAYYKSFDSIFSWISLFFIDWQHKSCIQVSTTINFKVM